MTRTPSEAPSPLPTGLVLFPPGTSPAKKLRRLLFLAAYLLVVAALIWPVYPFFAGIRPLILGLPLSLAWIIMVLGVGLVTLLALYLTEEEPAAESPPAET